LRRWIRCGFNPKQFRNRFIVAGAEGDRSDILYVMVDSLRTDRHAFRRLSNDERVIVKLREWSRMADDLQQERTRLASRMREQLWRYCSQMLELADDPVLGRKVEWCNRDSRGRSAESN
jgi:hypothetical protein